MIQRGKYLGFALEARRLWRRWAGGFCWRPGGL